MSVEIYTPGHDQAVIEFMSRRTIASHARFIEPLLKPGRRVLDLGCGPGTITLDLARRLTPAGSVVGVDRNDNFYPENDPIVEHIASQLERDGQRETASVWRSWGENPQAMFAQAWFEAIALKAGASSGT